MNRAWIGQTLDKDPKLKRKKPDIASAEKLNILLLIDMAKERFGDTEGRLRGNATRTKLQQDRLQLDMEQFDLKRIENTQPILFI